MIRCMVVDDLQSIREHFKDLLDLSEDIEAVALAANGREAVELAFEHKPDIILMDVQLEYDVAGIDAAAEIMTKLPDTKIIILTVHNNDRFILDAYLAGAVDYIIKNDDRTDKIVLTRSSDEGRTWSEQINCLDCLDDCEVL